MMTGCGRNEAAPVTTADTGRRTAVDSILPVQEEIRRFKSARRDVTAHALSNGAASRDQLVDMFITAVEHRDTITLGKLAMNETEFIDLYYPTSQFAKPPYKQSPELRWFLLRENSDKGINRLLQRYSGGSVHFKGYTCADLAVTEGKNRLWDRCTVSWGQPPRTIRLFSTIIERDGRFKFMSYANGL